TAQEVKAEIFCGALAAAFRKDVNLVVAMGANKVAHVLNHADNIHLDLSEHFDGFARVLEGDVGRRRNHDGACEWHSLDQRQCHVASTRGEVYDQVIQLSPLHLSEKLLDDR